MVEDKLLVWKLNRGNIDALSCIYEKYRDDLLKLTTALLKNTSDAEDIVHDVFLEFALSAGEFQLSGSLKSYLATCVANKARNRNQAKQRQGIIGLDNAGAIASKSNRPDQWLTHNEELKQINEALDQLPYEQREAIALKLHGQMKFREIAKLQNVSIATIQSRYRYGLDKMRLILNDEVKK